MPDTINFTLFPNQIEKSAAEKLVDGCDDALVTLVNLGVVHIDGLYLSMQPTLRDYIKETEEYPSDIPAIVVGLIDHYIGICGENGVRNLGSKEDAYASERLSDALFLMKRLVEEQDMGNIGRLHRCIREYYQNAPYEAIIPVEAAVNLPGLEEDYLKASLLEYCGVLEMHTDKLKEAEGHYKEAEKLYRRIQYDLGLANVLKEQGDLEFRTDKLKKAEGHYKKAEELYRRTQDDLGFANVLKAQGNLEMRTDKLKEAEGHYKEAA